MELQNTIERLLDSLDKQGLTFNENLTTYDLVKGFNEGAESKSAVTRALSRFSQKFTSYEDIDKSKFNEGIKRAQEKVGDQILLGWKYSLTCLIVTGIIHADDMTNAQLKESFDRLEETAVDIFLKHVGKGYSDTKGAVYCTFIPVFADSNKVKLFKENIKQYYKSHLWKSVFTSTMCVDCTGECLIMGKNIVGEWKVPGLDRTQLNKDIFG